MDRFIAGSVAGAAATAFAVAPRAVVNSWAMQSGMSVEFIPTALVLVTLVAVVYGIVRSS